MAAAGAAATEDAAAGGAAATDDAAAGGAATEDAAAVETAAEVAATEDAAALWTMEIQLNGRVKTQEQAHVVLDAVVTATQDPKGPASAGLRQRMMQASPLGPPAQVVPLILDIRCATKGTWRGAYAGICATRVKFFATLRLKPLSPGTFCVTVAALKVLPPSVETSQV